MNIIKAPIASVIPWDKNPRKIQTKDFARLKKQILKLGVYKPLIAFEEKCKYVVLGGNMRIRTLKDMGLKEVDISVVAPKTEAEKVEFALSDNDRVGAYDEQALAELIYPYIKDIDLGDFKVDLGEAIDLKQVVERYGPDIDDGADKVLGRKLKRNEIIHHINGNKTDNRNSNLMICSASYHRWLENKMAFLYKQEHFNNDRAY